MSRAVAHTGGIKRSEPPQKKILSVTGLGKRVEKTNVGPYYDDVIIGLSTYVPLIRYNF